MTLDVNGAEVTSKSSFYIILHCLTERLNLTRQTITLTKNRTPEKVVAEYLKSTF